MYSHLNQIRSLILLMGKSERYKLITLLLVSIANALMQTLGLISIMPFIALISDPSMADSQPHIIWIKNAFGLTSYRELLILFGGFSFISLFLSNTLIIINYWISLKFFNNFGLKSSTKLLTNYLNNPFKFFFKKSTSQLSKHVFSDVDRVIVGSLLAYVSIFTDVITLIVVSGFLLYINPLTTIITIISLMVCYVLTYIVLAKKIDTLGENFTSHEASIFSSIKESLVFYREIKVSGSQQFFITKYMESAKELYKGSTVFYALKFIPIQIIELSIFVIILLISGYLALSEISIGITITTISIYAFSAYRIIPVLKNIFDSTEEILHAKSIFIPLIEELKSNSNHVENRTQLLKIENKLTLDEVSYAYPNSKFNTVQNISIQINKGELFCIIGKSGSGKTTLLDIILGLIEPDSGAIKIDQEKLTKESISEWQKCIGYAPQKIHLLEASVLSNIAFGIPKEEINFEQVQYCARIACIDELIENHLPSQYNTIIGEGGQPLSGGEIQRIGVARSLYNKPNLLILDEVTNALDAETESLIIKNLKSISDVTTIFVTHRSSVIIKSDNHINLSNIKVKIAQ